VSTGAGTPATPDETVVERPVLRVVRGTPDATELAVLVAVVTAMTGGDVDGAAPPRSSWAAPHRLVRQPMTFGGWRASFAPR
jgi:hypothetical protein